MKKIADEIEENHNNLNTVIQSFRDLQRSFSPEKKNLSTEKLSIKK